MHKLFYLHIYSFKKSFLKGSPVRNIFIPNALPVFLFFTLDALLAFKPISPEHHWKDAGQNKDQSSKKRLDRISHQFLTTPSPVTAELLKWLLLYCALARSVSAGSAHTNCKPIYSGARDPPGTDAGCCYYMHSIFLAFHHRSHTHTLVLTGSSNTNSNSPCVCLTPLPHVTLTVAIYISVANLLSTSSSIISRQT